MRSYKNRSDLSANSRDIHQVPFDYIIFQSFHSWATGNVAKSVLISQVSMGPSMGNVGRSLVGATIISGLLFWLNSRRASIIVPLRHLVLTIQAFAKSAVAMRGCSAQHATWMLQQAWLKFQRVVKTSRLSENQSFSICRVQLSPLLVGHSAPGAAKKPSLPPLLPMGEIMLERRDRRDCKGRSVGACDAQAGEQCSKPRSKPRSKTSMRSMTGYPMSIAFSRSLACSTVGLQLAASSMKTL